MKKFKLRAAFLICSLLLAVSVFALFGISGNAVEVNANTSMRVQFGLNGVSPDEWNNYEGLSFTLINNGAEYSVSDDGINTEFLYLGFPKYYENLPVTKIDDYAFYECEIFWFNIDEIEVGTYAFNDSQIEHFTASNAIIGEGAFNDSQISYLHAYCDIVIEESAFSNCEIISVYMNWDHPEFAEIEIKDNAFSFSTINDFYISGNIIIAEGAFSYCADIQYLYIGNAHTAELYNLENSIMIGENAFSYCDYISNLYISGDVTINEGAFNNSILDGVYFWGNIIFEQYSFYDCNITREITVNDKNVFWEYSQYDSENFYTEIKDFAFYGSAIPDQPVFCGALYFEDYAFDECVAYNWGNYDTWTSAVFRDAEILNAPLNKFCSIFLEGDIIIADYAFRYSSKLDHVYVENLENVIFGEYAFSNCPNLFGIKGFGVGTDFIVNDYAFSNCAGLTYVNFLFADNPSCNLDIKIGKSAFSNCNSLVQVFEDGFADNQNISLTIDQYAFSFCNNLREVNILSSSQNTSVNALAFYQSSALEVIFTPAYSDSQALKAVPELLAFKGFIKPKFIELELDFQGGQPHGLYSDKIMLTYSYEEYYDSLGKKIINGGDYFICFYDFVPDAIRPGYILKGWNERINGYDNLIINEFYSIEETNWDDLEDTTIYAIWEGIKYTVDCDHKDDPTGLNNTVTKEYATFGELYEWGIPVRAGYIFKGWYDAPNGSGTQFTGDDGLSLNPWSITNNSSAYAKWESLLIYTRLPDGNFSVRRANGQISGEIVIPEKHNDGIGVGYVTMIEADGFYACSNLTSITIPYTVKSIGARAFYQCTNLTAVIFAGESRLTSIGAQAFMQCSALQEIIIPAGVSALSNELFNGCASLTNVYLERDVFDGIVTLGQNVFANCAYFTNYGNIYVADRYTVNEYKNSQIYNGLLNSLINPKPNNNSYHTVNYTYLGATGLVGGNPLLASQIVYANEYYKLVVPVRTNYTFDGWFDQNGNRYTWGNGICLSKWTHGNINLEARYIDVRTLSFTLINNNTEYSVSRLSANATPIIPAFYNGIPVTEIAIAAFKNGAVVTSVTIPWTIKVIGEEAFYGCSLLANVIFENVNKSQLTTIGIRAFALCTSLQAIEIPKGVQSFNNGTFNGCTALRSVTMYNSVDVVTIFPSVNVFASCLNITIYVPSHLLEAYQYEPDWNIGAIIGIQAI